MVFGAGVMEAGLLEVCLTRRVAASPDVVFAAWIKKEHLAKWWGPKGFTTLMCEVDARIGGAMMIEMCSPDGVVCPMTGRFVTIDRPHRLVFVTAAIDGAGTPMFEVLNTVIFTEARGGTEISLVARVIKTTPAAPPYLSGMTEGWCQSLDRLTDQLAWL
ncbi:SRPBCC domain-containing protein [Granulicella sp. S190]|uniref:SRPBCC family protein n=1 Tax=Granulicella sp. S190 TaxID=1747226 RepID=UPI00131E5532|nr:SRPBCC domain-containing protein [Granulicella sp. S190]